MRSVFHTINTALRHAGLTQRFVRGRGYYYVTDVSVSSGWYGGMGIAPTTANLNMIRDHVNAVLADEGIHFHIGANNVCIAHPVAYTGYLRSVGQTATPLSVEAWRETITIKAKS